MANYLPTTGTKFQEKTGIEIGEDAMESISSQSSEGSTDDEALGLCGPPVPRKMETLKSLNLEVLWKSDKPPLRFLALKLSTVKHPCVLQYAISSKKIKEFVEYKLGNRDLELSVKNLNSGYVQISLKGEDIETEADVMNKLTEAFDNVLKDLTYFTFYKGTTSHQLFENAKSEELDQLLFDEELMLLESPEGLYMVGDEKDLNKVKTKLHLQTDAKREVKNIRQWSDLETLKIQQHLERENIKIVTENKDDKLTIMGSTSEIERAEKIIQEFSATVREKEVKLKSKEHNSLLQKDNQRNEFILGHFMNRLTKEKVPCVVEIRRCNGEYAVFVSSTSEKAVAKAEKIIQDSIHDHSFRADKKKCIESLLTRWKKKKLIVSSLENGMVKIVCASDVSEEILKALQGRKQIHFLPVIGKFFETHGRESIDSLGKTHSLNLKVDMDVLHVEGEEENIKSFEEDLQKIYVKDRFYLEVPPSSFNEHEVMISQKAKENNCCFQAKYMYQEMQNSTCKSIAAWKNSNGNEKVTFVTGHIGKIQMENRILFTTDKGFPLHKFKGEDSEIQDSVYPLSKQFCKDKYEVGDILQYPLSNGKDTLQAIVLTKSNYSESEERISTTKFNLETTVFKVMNKAVGGKAKSVVIPFCLLYENMPPVKVVTACVRALKSLPADTDLHLYLICDKEEDEVAMAHVIDDVYNREQKNGMYFRDVLSDDISFKHGYQNIDVKVKKDSLVDMKMGVIVNTVAHNLDLEKGKLSEQILRKAGNEIQEECYQRYPDGIKYGDVAITSAGRLKADMIFHCALHPFDKTNFCNNVKSMVRRCLHEMEKGRKKTIWFPALGTGRLGYPVCETANAMFDAVDSCVNSCIEEVVFVMTPEDEQVYHAFYRELKKRRSKQHEVRPGRKGYPILSIQTKTDNGVELKVVRETDRDHISQTVVEVKCSSQEGDSKGLILSSEAKCTEDRDILHVHIEKSCSFEDLMYRVLELSLKNKLSEILIPIFRDYQSSAVEQIKAIQNIVLKYKLSRLLAVYIVVQDNSLDILQTKLNEEDRYFASMRSRKPVWKQEKCTVELRIIGKTRESVSKMKQEICACLKQANKPRKDFQAVDVRNEDNNATSVHNNGHDSQDAKTEVDLVNAELNPGIVTYLEQNGCFESWKSKIATSYSLCIETNACKKIIVKGKFDDLLCFEKYLGEDFPKDPEQKTSEKTEVNATDDEYRCTTSETVNLADKKGTTANKMGLTVQAEGKVKYSCKIGDLEICFLLGDIEQLEVDCIVSFRVHNDQSKTLSRDALKNAELKAGDYYLGDSEKLLCKKVMCFGVPVWSEKKQICSLQEMLEVLLKCFINAEKENFSSVALPLKCSGFPIHLLTQQYYRALREFSKDRKSVCKVYLVENDLMKMGNILHEFDQLLNCQIFHEKPTNIALPVVSFKLPSYCSFVTVDVVHGNVEAVVIDAVVSTEDIYFSGESCVAKALWALGDQKYREDHAALRKENKDKKTGSVFLTKVSGGQILCQYVLHTVVPRRNKNYCQDTSLFERDITCAVQNVLDRATKLNCRSIAMPLFGVSEDRKTDTDVVTCCKSMVAGVAKFLDENVTTLNRIELICIDKAVVSVFCNEMKEAVHGTRETQV